MKPWPSFPRRYGYNLTSPQQESISAQFAGNKNYCRRHTISWPKQRKEILTMLKRIITLGVCLRMKKNRCKHLANSRKQWPCSRISPTPRRAWECFNNGPATQTLRLPHSGESLSSCLRIRTHTTILAWHSFKQERPLLQSPNLNRPCVCAPMTLAIRKTSAPHTCKKQISTVPSRNFRRL